jgi:hypothetical protein
MDVSRATSAGIVPGFPAKLPMQLENAWLALVRHPEHVSLDVLAKDTAQITIKKNRRALWGLTLLCLLSGLLGIVGTWLFDRYQSSDSFDLPLRFRTTKLYVAAGICVGVGLLLMLINLAAGGVERNTVIEAALGRLKIDRWVSGDHVVREYSRDEVSEIWTDGAIEIGWRLGAFGVAPFAPAKVQDAVAEIVGTLFWGDDACVARKIRSRYAANGKMKVVIRPKATDS